jgi:comEA protein
MWIFTPPESKAIVFILVVLLVGTGVLTYRRYNPDFAPELLSGESKTAVASFQKAQSDMAVSDTLSQISEAEVQSEKSKFKINLNTASLEEFERLPHIGPVLAKRIVDYRYERGGFGSLEEIIKVKGVGKKTYQAIKAYLALE